MNIENKNYPDLDEIKKLKSITDLYSYNIRPEKEAGKLIIDKIYFKDYILYSLSAIVWQKNNLAKYKKITEYSKVWDLEQINPSKIRNKLIFQLYMRVIKNEIKML